MSSFFTLPASQSKRKRAARPAQREGNGRSGRSRDDESISGSEVSDDELGVRGEAFESDEEEEYEDEDPAAKRVRLAEQYLANTEREVLEDAGFDAADVDRENLSRRMGERLKQDTAESKGKLYRWISTDLEWQKPRLQSLRYHRVTRGYTGVAVHGRQIYAVSKDMHLVKWQLPDRTAAAQPGQRAKSSSKVVASRRGNKKTPNVDGHHGAILCIAVSPDGKFVATGGKDKKLVVWDATTLRILKTFTHHRDAVTALAFRRGTNQLFSASKDRTVKIWSLDELAYVETLFGHQDEVVGVDALAQEECVTVGARDRTARLWRVVEESQLVFRGGGAPSKSKTAKALRAAYGEESGIDLEYDEVYHEGSIDRVAVIDDETFVTGSDNGSLSLWDIRKKKPVFTWPLAHGFDPALPLMEASAELQPDEDMDEKGRGGKRPRWITALKAIPFSDVIVSGSWDGYVRVWRISRDKRQIEPLGAIVTSHLTDMDVTSPADHEPKIPSRGVINDLAICDSGERGKDGVLVAAAIAKQHRLGAWSIVPSNALRQSIALFEIPRVVLNGNGTGSVMDDSEEQGEDGDVNGVEEAAVA